MHLSLRVGLHLPQGIFHSVRKTGGRTQLVSLKTLKCGLSPEIMMRYTSGMTVTTAETEEPGTQGNIRRLRLILHADEPPSKPDDSKPRKAETEEKSTTPTRRRKRNGFVYPERNGPDQPVLHLVTVPNVVPSDSSPQRVVYGVVHRPDSQNQEDVFVYEWSVNQLREEMNYIKDVRTSLEKARERMCGEYNGMKQRIQELTREMQVSRAQQEILQNEAGAQSSALDSYSQLNSSLTSVTIGLQIEQDIQTLPLETKTLLETTLENASIRDEVKNVRQSYEKAMENEKEARTKLEAAQSENQILKVKLESSQEANAEVMRNMTRKLFSQYEAKLCEEEEKHKAEKEALQAKTTQFLKEVEEAHEKIKNVERRIHERDERIGELDRLIIRMEEERHQLQSKLEECEQQLSEMHVTPRYKSPARSKRSQQLEEEAANLRERIKHLDNMVYCQQKKVKQMIEEIERLKNCVRQKDMQIEQLLERISFLEAENTELQDKLNYLMSKNESGKDVETRDAEVSCNLQPSDTTDSPSTQITQRRPTILSSTYKKAYTPYMRLMEISSEKLSS